MTKSSIRIAVIFVLAGLASTNVRSETEVSIAKIDLGNEISDDFARFVATQSVSSQSLRTSGKIVDLVRETCGFESPDNIKVFEFAVTDQGGLLDQKGGFAVQTATTRVPTCLPDESKLRIVGRLPQAGDTLSQYQQIDIGGDGLLTGADLTLAPTSVPENLTTLDPGTSAGIQDLIATLDTADTQTDDALVNLAEQYFRKSNVNPMDRSRIAYETFSVTNDMLDVGLDRAKARRAVKGALDRISAPDTELILRDADAAIDAGQSVPRVRDLPVMAEACGQQDTQLAGLCDQQASGKAVSDTELNTDVIGKLNTSDRVKNIDTIYRNVPVLSVERVNRTADVPIAAGADVPDGVTVENAPEDSPTQLTLFLNVFDGVEGAADHQCTEGTYRNWSSDEFKARFLAAVDAAVQRKTARDGALSPTVLEVLDGGFFRFEPEAFGEGDWSILTPPFSHSNQESLNGMADDVREKITHGTAVTSLAMGGPGLMGQFGPEGLPVTIMSRPIYRAVSMVGKTHYILIDRIDDVIASDDADIVNMSFGTLNDNEANLRAVKDTLLGRTGALLVVAAGNNGNNDAERGRSIAATRLVPQIWGTAVAADSHSGGWNILVVAGIDSSDNPERLAWFSNFGGDMIYLAAPACRIKAITATLDGNYALGEFNGTSFAAPIVSFVAAAVRTVLPRGRNTAPWIRARLVSTADIVAGIAEDKVHSGRVLNPVAAMQVYDDVVTLKAPLVAGGPTSLVGEISEIGANASIQVGSLCEDNFNQPHTVLRLFRGPDVGADGIVQWSVDIMGPNDFMMTEPCIPRTNVTVKIATEAGNLPVRIEDIDDIRFSFARGANQ